MGTFGHASADGSADFVAVMRFEFEGNHVRLRELRHSELIIKSRMRRRQIDGGNASIFCLAFFAPDHSPPVQYVFALDCPHAA